MKWAVPALAIGIVALTGCGAKSNAKVAAEVSVGDGHACARMVDGTVRCWGAVGQGQRGDGVLLEFAPWEFVRQNRLVARAHFEEIAVPNQVVGLTDVEELTSGGAHSCARRKGGTVWCWGSNSARQIVSDDSDDVSYRKGSVPYPVKIPELMSVAQLAAGRSHTCARRADGSVWCWGEDVYGQTGHPSHRVAQVPLASGATDVRAAGDNSCALLLDGTVRCWGHNEQGQAGDGTAGIQQVVPVPTRLDAVRDANEVSVGANQGCARTRSSAVKCWAGREIQDSKVSASLTALKIASGPKNTCAIGQEGSLTCWGDYELLRSLAPSKPAAAVDGVIGAVGKVQGARQLVVGEDHACVLLETGAVQCWGASWRDASDRGSYDLPGPFTVEGFGKAVQLSAWANRSCAVTEDGKVHCWGARRKLETIEGVTEATLVSLGLKHACARKKKGKVVCWGEGLRGQLGYPCREEGIRPPQEVAGLQDVEQLASGGSTTCARLKDATVRCWGDNRNGQLGQAIFSSVGTESLKAHPVMVGLPESAVQIAGGEATMCAVLASGAIACWGNNTSGIVIPTESMAAHNNKPATQVLGVRDAVQIAVAPTHACALGKGGNVTCWGSNERGQMGDGTMGTGNLRMMPVALPKLARSSQLWVATDATCGRLADGRIVCYGAGQAAPFEIPGLLAAVSVSLSSRVSEYWRQPSGRPSGCAVMTNGALACWGSAGPISPGEVERPEIPIQVRW